MTSPSRDQDISLAKSDPDNLWRRFLASVVSCPAMINCEMAAITLTVPTKNIWNVRLSTQMTRPSSGKEEDVVDLSPTDEDDDLLIETDYMRPVHAEMKDMIQYASFDFQESTFDLKIEAMVEIKSASILKTTNQEAGKGEKTTAY